MLEKARLAVRVTTEDFDPELLDLIDAALADLKGAGVRPPAPDDPLISRAVMTFVRMNFGSPPNYAELKAAYDEQKGQMRGMTGYTDWGGGNG